MFESPTVLHLRDRYELVYAAPHGEASILFIPVVACIIDASLREVYTGRPSCGQLGIWIRRHKVVGKT